MELPAEWIELTIRGDPAAREALSAWCLRRAYRVAYADLGEVPNRETLAEEIAGEATLKAIRHLGQFRPGTRFEHWLHQIVRNCARDAFRRLDQAVPQAVYQRWIHDFLVTHRQELETVIDRECGDDASVDPRALMHRIVADLSRRSYPQLMRLSYDGRAGAALNAVKRWLRSFVGVDWTSLYEKDEEGDWVEVYIEGPNETEALVLQQEFVERVNALLRELLPQCRRLLRWHYLDHLRVTDIARLEQISERTAYRRLESCASSFRVRLQRGGYFAEFTGNGGSGQDAGEGGYTASAAAGARRRA